MTKQESLDFLDNCIEYINHLSPKEISNIFTSFDKNDETFTMSSFERKWINRIKKYSEQYPNDVKITYINEDGSIMAEINKKWFKISPPRKVSDKQRELASQRFKALHKQENKGGTNELE